MNRIYSGNDLKTRIIKLRAKGKTYKEICSILHCSKGTVAYYLGDNQPAKSRARKNKSRKKNPINRKIESFKHRGRRGLRNKIYKFHRSKITENKIRLNKLSETELNFGPKEVLEKLGVSPVCYLSGRPIDLSDPLSYHFDHIIPVSKGGLNVLSNLGVACKEANQAKNDTLLEDFLLLCQEIVNYNKK